MGCVNKSLMLVIEISSQSIDRFLLNYTILKTVVIILLNLILLHNFYQCPIYDLLYNY